MDLEQCQETCHGVPTFIEVQLVDMWMFVSFTRRLPGGFKMFVMFTPIWGNDPI